MNYAKIVLYSSFILPITACHSMTKIPAERCVLVDIHGKQSNDLIPIFDSFAAQHNLMALKSDPANTRYEIKKDEQYIVEMMYTMGMGRFGAVLTLFRYDPSNGDLPTAFDTFVEREIAPKYKVTKCSDVPDFQIPSVYR